MPETEITLEKIKDRLPRIKNASGFQIIGQEDCCWLLESCKWLINKVEELEKELKGERNDVIAARFYKEGNSTLDKLLALNPNPCHYIDIRCRRDGHYEWYEGDFLKRLDVEVKKLQEENESLKAKCMRIATIAGDLSSENEKLRKVVEAAKNAGKAQVILTGDEANK